MTEDMNNNEGTPTTPEQEAPMAPAEGQPAPAATPEAPADGAPADNETPTE